MSAAWWARAGCLAAVGLSLAATPMADAAPLRLDTSFGKGGIARVPVPTHADYKVLIRPLRPVRQSDGKVLVAAAIEGDRGDPAQVALARFNRNGRPDPTFGRGGRVRLGAHWNFDPRALQVLPDGRIFLMGAAGTGPSLYPLTWPSQIGLIRLLPDGSRDRTFGRKGFVAWNPPWRGTDMPIAMPGLLLPQADGRLLVASTVNELARGAQPWRVALVRFNQNGSVDESFGRAGVSEALDGRDVFYWVALPDGQPVALRVGVTSTGFFDPPTWLWSLYRFTADGAPNAGFGQGAPIPAGDVLAGITDLVAASDGSVVVLGNDQRGATATELRRILPAGQLDAAFGTACGRRTLGAFGGGGAALTPNGGVFVSGTTYLMRGLFVRYDTRGCVADQLRATPNSVSAAGPPLLVGRHTALAGATYDQGLALIRIRR